MNNRRASAILDGQSATARKVFSFVPLGTPKAARDIYASLAATSNVSYAVVSGCLNDLKSNGLIKEPTSGNFIRRQGLTVEMALTCLGDDQTIAIPKLAEVLKPVIAGTRHAQPIPVTKTKETLVIKEPQATTQPAIEPVDTLEQLSDIAVAIEQRIRAFSQGMSDLHIELTEDMDNLRKRLEDVALEIENERKASGDAANTLKMLRGLLAGKES